MQDVRDLIARAKISDLDAFDELVRRFQGMACGYAYSILGDFGLAEDAAQCAFVEAYCDLAKLRESSAFASWLRRIIFKQCNRITRRKTLTTVPLDTAGEIICGSPDLQAQAEGRDTRRQVMDAVRALPEGERVVTTLYYIDGYSVDEVGSFLSLPSGTVKSRLHSARKKLREGLWNMVEETLKQNGPGDPFTRRVAEAVRLFSSKGPSDGQIGSEWEKAIHSKIAEIVRLPYHERRRTLEALCDSDRSDVRDRAATTLGISADPSGIDLLERLMHDPVAKVRRTALMWYALLMHPQKGDADYWTIHRPADSVPEAVDNLIPMVEDENQKVKMAAVNALMAYAHLSDPRVETALHKALDDAEHKVKHQAARALQIECPECGDKPPAFQYRKSQ